MSTTSDIYLKFQADTIANNLGQTNHNDKTLKELTIAIKDYLELGLNNKDYLNDMLHFVKGRLPLLSKHPDLLSAIAEHSFRRIDRYNAEVISIVESFTAHKDTSTVVYMHMIKNRPKVSEDLRKFINRECFNDLFGLGPRSRAIRKNLHELGVSEDEMEKHESFLLRDINYLMRPHDLEMSSLIHDSEDLMDVVMCMGDWKRNDIISTLLSGLDKVTLNEKKFTKMAKLIIYLIDNNVGSNYSFKMPEQYREAILCIAKMAAKPGYQRSGVLIDQVSQLVEDHPEALTLESALYSAIATDFSDSVVNAIKQSPIKREMEQAGERTLLAAIKRMSSTKVAPYRLVQAFDLAIRDEKLTRLKRDSLARDFNI